jgi:hypothetical protein
MITLPLVRFICNDCGCDNTDTLAPEMTCAECDTPFTPDDLAAMPRETIAPECPMEAFEAQCDAMARNANDNAKREFWRRLAGSVRKAATMI